MNALDASMILRSARLARVLLLGGLAACSSKVPMAVPGATPVAAPAEASAAAPVQPSQPTGREVVERYAALAHLGESLAKTSSLHAKGKFALEAMGLEGVAEVWSAKPDRRLVTMEMGAFGTMVTGYDGRTAWMTHPMMGARLLADTELLQIKLEAAYDSALKPERDYESLQNLGRESFEGKDCWKVEAVAKPLEGMDPEKTRAARTTIEYYEVESGLLLGNSGRQEGEMGGGPYTTVFSDYRDFGGHVMAAKTRVRQAGQEITLTIESVEYDTATDATFAPPVEVQKLIEARGAKAGAGVGKGE
jgi:hypothetical protein